MSTTPTLRTCCLPSSGSYNAGKTERGEINFILPGDGFPGADICKNCPLILFHKAKKTLSNVAECFEVVRKPGPASMHVSKHYGFIPELQNNNIFYPFGVTLAFLRQISLLAKESIAKMKAAGLDVDYGDFAESLTTEGIHLASLPIGSQLFIGETVLEVTQIGKECHHSAVPSIIKLVTVSSPKKGFLLKLSKAVVLSLEIPSDYKSRIRTD